MSMRKEVKRGVYIVSALVSIAVLCVVLAFSNYDRESRKHHEILEFLGNAKDLDRIIDEDVLLTRSFLLSNYDSLVWATDTISKLCADTIHLQLLGETAREYCAAVHRKLDIIEEFKSNNSLLRNERTYLPLLIDQFQGTRYDESSDHLMIFIFRYFLEQTEANRSAVERNLAWVDGAAKDQRFKESALSLRMHVRTLLESMVTRTRLQEDIFSGSVRVRYSLMETTYLDAYAVAETRSAWYRVALLVLTGLLALGLVLIVVRLNHATQALDHLNRNLEKRVEERTSELQEALQKIEASQELISQTTKMSALGEMAGGIAHEINTPLAAILLMSESLERTAQQAGQAEIVNGLQGVAKTVQRIAKIVTGLRRFSRDSSSEKPRAISVAEIIDETLILCQEKFRNHGVELTVDRTHVGLLIECVPEQVSQVVLNLLNNAFDAIGSLPVKWVKLETKKNGDQIEISVTDSGGGIPPEVRKKLMQPFFTTKEIGKGTGLGLSISKGLIEAQRGSLVYDEKCANTRFVIRIPEFDEYRVA